MWAACAPCGLPVRHMGCLCAMWAACGPIGTLPISCCHYIQKTGMSGKVITVNMWTMSNSMEHRKVNNSVSI